MDQEIQFLLYAIGQEWIEADKAKELLEKRAGSDESLDQLAASDDYLGNEERVKHCAAAVGMSLSAEDLLSVGEYEIVERIGAGGHGVVFRAHPELSSDDIAIKVLATRLSDDLIYLENFTSRAEKARLHMLENVATTIDAGNADGYHFLASEFVKGESVADQAKRNALPEEEVARIGSEVCRALVHAAKKDLCHGGIRPADIRITPEGEVSLLDFGLARETPEKETLEIAFALGAEHYLSPEQAAGEKGDIRSDIFSLGAALSLAATGQAPFAGETSGTVLEGSLPEPEGLSEGLRAVLARMLARSPEDRYASPEDLKKDFDRLASGEEPKGAALAAGKSLLGAAAAGGEESEAAAEEVAESENDKEDEPTNEPIAEETRRIAAAPGTAPPSRSVPTIRSGRSRVSRLRQDADAEQKSILPKLGIILPVIIILVGLVFVIMQKKENVVVGPKITQLDNKQQQLLTEYKGIRDYIQLNPTRTAKARARIKKFEAKVKNNIAWKNNLIRLKADLKRLEKNFQATIEEEEKANLRSDTTAPSIALNGSFEEGEDDAPDNWRLVGNNGTWETEGGATGKRCLMVSGYYGPSQPKKSRSPYWTSSVYPIENHQLYKVAFKIKTDLWRSGKSAHVKVGGGYRNYEPDISWKPEEFFFVAQARTQGTSVFNGQDGELSKRAEVRLGVGSRPGKVYFDDLRVVKARPWNKKSHGMTLGVGESVEKGLYSFKMKIDSQTTNYSRCLQNSNAGFTQTSWVLDVDRTVLYAHEIETYTQQGGFITIQTERHGKGAVLKVEVSKNMADWKTIFTHEKKGVDSIRLSKEDFYPTETLYVKFSGEGPVHLKAYTYKADLKSKSKTRISFKGKTEFFE